MRINFLGQEENPELLLPSASDRVWVGAIAEDRRPRLDDERLAGFNQSADLSTYPRKISVRTSRATAVDRGSYTGLCEVNLSITHISRDFR
jgi:hypothetical protein